MAGKETTATIVCGVDGGDASPAVVDTARWLAEAFNAQLIVAHAFDEPVSGADQIMADLRRRTAADRHVETRLVEGSPAERLLEIAREENAKWLVVGSRGRGSLAAGLLGSVSRALVQKASCPVVVVPASAAAATDEAAGDGADSGEPSIVCGVDGSDHALAAARLAGDLAAQLGFRVIVVHAPRTPRSLLSYVGRSTTPSLSEQPDSAARKTNEIVEAALGVLGDRPSSSTIEAGEPAQVLEAVARRENGRLIVVAGRGQSAVQGAILGSVATSLAGSATVPVVVLPELAENHVKPVGTGAETSP